MFPLSRRVRAALLAAFLAILLVPIASSATPSDDPLPGMTRRIERYLRQNEVDGVTMDWRYNVIPSEEIRQTVVCQILGYAELYRLHPSGRIQHEIAQHADFLLGRLSDVRSHSPFDGMLAFSLFSAYQATGEARFLAAARDVEDELLAIPTSQCVLNGGLMVAMATALDAELTGNATAAQKTHDILVQLEPFQNEDGSFPHWCGGTRDIHYTGWMTVELIHIARLTSEPLIDPMLHRMADFLASRIGPDGRAVYEDRCPDPYMGCDVFYDSRRSGCAIDYDTRGWTVEPAYCALAFDHVGAPQYRPVITFLDSLEDGGTLPDLYAYWPPPDDPEYPWTIADTSVVNMSIIFWVLATDLTDRAQRGMRLTGAYDDGDPAPVLAGPATLAAVMPNPSAGASTISFILDDPEDVSISIFDPRVRLVRVADLGRRPAGAGAWTWDGRDRAGHLARDGVYLIRVRAGTTETTARALRIGSATTN